MIDIFKNFNDTNYFLIEKMTSAIEVFCTDKLVNIEKNNPIYNKENEITKMPSGHNLYSPKTAQKKYDLYLSMTNDHNKLQDQLESYLKNIELNFLKSGFTNTEYLKIETTIKIENDINLKLNFNYSLISKNALLISIDIPNDFVEKCAHRFQNNSESLVLYIGEEKKELGNNSGEKLSNLDFIEIMSENGVIKRFFGLTENYEKMFEIKENHNIEDTFEERNNIKNTHDFYKVMRKLTEKNPELAYKCAFGNNENIQELSDLLLINYDIVFKENFKLFHLDLSQYNNIKKLKKKEERNLKI